MVENYNKIIESIKTRFVKAGNINIINPITVENNYEVENYLILVTGGQVKFGKEKTVASKGEIIFIPAGKATTIAYGEVKSLPLSKDDFLTNKDHYLKSYKGEILTEEHYTFVAFEAKAYDSVNFFSSLDFPPFKIVEQHKLANLIRQVATESDNNVPGRNRVLDLLTGYLGIELIRYILKNDMFVEKLATNSTYFKDPRIITILTYIKENISNDLSNKVLAKIANISEDYVGQYFKMTTGINPQDYIEYQRMEEAVNLLRSSKLSVKEIGKAIGYKDTAYFCRRFKMVFGIPAGRMRRRESLFNV